MLMCLCHVVLEALTVHCVIPLKMLNLTRTYVVGLIIPTLPINNRVTYVDVK